jgi:hypothetical protein
VIGIILITCRGVALSGLRYSETFGQLRSSQAPLFEMGLSEGTSLAFWWAM